MPGVGSNPNWPSMQVLVDFTNPGTASVTPVPANGTFDSNINGWNNAGASTLAQSITTKHDGVGSLQITWTGISPSGTLGAFGTSGGLVTGLVAGSKYNVSMWMMVPNGSASSLSAQAQGLGSDGFISTASAAIPIDGAWHQVILAVTIGASGGFVLNFSSTAATVANQLAYVDTITIATPWTDITQWCRRLGTSGNLMHVEGGRNYERAQTDAGTCTFNLDNSTGAFDPGNSASPYYPNVKPIRKIQVNATWTPLVQPNVIVNGTFDVDLKGWLNASLNSPIVAPTTPVTVMSRGTSTVHDGAGSMNVVWASSLAAGNGKVQYGIITGLAPGSTYSCTAWVYLVSGGTVTMTVQDSTGLAPVTVNSGAGLGAWQQISVNYVVPVSGTLRIIFSNTALTGASDTLNIDTVTATNTAAPTPVTYNLFYGEVEDWPRVWSAAGFRGDVTATARGVFSSLANVLLNAMWVQAAINDGASAIYRLNDPSGSNQAANSSSVQRDFALVVAFNTATTDQSKFSFGSVSGTGNLAGDPTPGLQFAPQPDTNNAKGFSLLVASQSTPNPQLILSYNGGWSVEFWFQVQSVPVENSGLNPGYTLFVQGDGSATGTTSNNGILAYINSSGFIQMAIQGATGNTGVGFTGQNYADGNWHHVVMTYDSSNNFTGYVDGVASSTINRVIGPWIHNPSNTLLAQVFGININVGGGLVIGGALNGTLKNIAIYTSTALTAAQVTNHFNAGGGYSLDDTGARIARILNGVPYPTQALDSGNSFLTSADLEGKNVVQAIQDANNTEAGTIMERGDGSIVFKNRHARGGTAPVAVFAETANPYEDGIQIQRDPREIYTTIKVVRYHGATIINVDTTATNDFYSRTLQIDSQDWSDQQAIYLSAYMLGRYKVARDRIPNLTIRPSHNPALWPVALGLKMGDRVTVTRANPGAPAVTGDYYIDKVTHDVQIGDWKTTYMLSSASLYDAWILGDGFFGVLGSTTILGF